MALKFPNNWRFEAPKSDNENTNRIPREAVYEFLRLIQLGVVEASSLARQSRFPRAL
jgi:hypothetical protein